MEKKLHIVSLLYGEAEDRSAFREVQDDEALRREYQAMSEAKFVLDHRPRRRPTPDVLEAVFAAAGAGEVAPDAPPERPGARAKDRSPRPGRIALRRRSFGLAGALLAACLLLTIGVWGLDGTDDLLGGLVASEDAAPASAQESGATADAADPASVRPAPSPARTEAATSGSPGPQSAGPSAAAQNLATAPPEALSGWDATAEVFDLHREVVLLEARSPDSLWDEPALPLELLQPSAAGRSGFQQARQPGAQRY